MPVHARIDCTETSGDQQCAHRNEVASELTPKSTSILLSAKSLIKTVSAMGVAVPYQAEVKVTHSLRSTLQNLLPATSVSRYYNVPSSGHYLENKIFTLLM